MSISDTLIAPYLKEVKYSPCNLTKLKIVLEQEVRILYTYINIYTLLTAKIVRLYGDVIDLHAEYLSKK